MRTLFSRNWSRNGHFSHVILKTPVEKWYKSIKYTTSPYFSALAHNIIPFRISSDTSDNVQILGQGHHPCVEGLFHNFLLSLHMAVDSSFWLYTEPSVLKVPCDLIICYAWMMCTYLAVFDSCDMNQSTKTPLSPFSARLWLYDAYRRYTIMYIYFLYMNVHPHMAGGNTPLRIAYNPST